MGIYAAVFACFFGTFVVAALFSLPVSAVVLAKSAATSAAAEIRC